MMKWCKDCRWNHSIYGYDFNCNSMIREECVHEKAPQYDEINYVTGEVTHRNALCQDMRTNGPCGVDALLFEPDDCERE